MRIYIGNAFSLSMLDREIQKNPARDAAHPNPRIPRIPRPVDNPAGLLADYVAAGCGVVSVVGHADTAAVFAAALGRPVTVNRTSIKLGKDEKLLVGQYIGPRLPEGATTLPDGATIEWWLV